ncbi:TatD family hydrolase [Wohlfahrtiimonas larvae]|uniref:TatD family hydrolase n=1 Tax=Wohlfahrtiimonas larvae TaxID=1157986 RepID=A0ABP9MSM7_9GAMM|nr:TatD family hydrolase [Wohlfahrtiimonas larvae]
MSINNSNKIHLFDSHIHLDDPRFTDDLSQLLTDARGQNIHDWIIPATTAETFQNIHHITQQQPHCYAAYGLHPYFIAQHTDESLSTLRSALIQYQPIAIGECGLDAMIEQPELDKQIYYFKAQIQLALEFDLPLIIHTRKTLDLVLKEIRKHPTLRGVLHSFSGSLQQAKIAIEHNFLLGFGGTITFTRAQKLRHIITELSLNDFIIETDAPFQRGAYRETGINYPIDLLEVAKTIAILRQEPLELIADATTNNTQKLFKLKDFK